jgi:ketosteroid isomerase-like protein
MESADSSILLGTRSRGLSRTHCAPLELESVARRLFDAFNRRDLAAALELVHPEIVFHPVSAAAMKGGEPYVGHDGIRRYIQDVEAHWEQLVVEPVQIRAAGRAVVALGQVSGAGALGRFEDLPTKWVLKFSDGLVVDAKIFADTPSP